MLHLFKSFRKRMAPELDAMFNLYLAQLAEASDQQIADALDVAKAIKDGTISDSGQDSYAYLFERPADVDENAAFRALRLWRHQMMSEGGTEEGLAKIAGLMIWYLSLAACHFPEFAGRADKLWEELSRGFSACKTFDPEKDALAGAGSGQASA